jgi:hypothetical protein
MATIYRKVAFLSSTGPVETASRGTF